MHRLLPPLIGALGLLVVMLPISTIAGENEGPGSRPRLIGIGAALRPVEAGAEIFRILPNRPAHLCGELKLGDKILAVGQGSEPPTDVAGRSLTDIVQLIRGPAGSEVRLTIAPADNQFVKRKIVALVRHPLRGEQLIGMKVDDVKLTSLADGKSVPLSKLVGKPVVIEFWSRTCAPCIAHIGKLQAFGDENPDLRNKCRIMTINIDNKRDGLADFATEKKWSRSDNYWGGKLAQSAFLADVIPHMVILDATGKVAAVGDPSEMNLRRLLMDLLER